MKYEYLIFNLIVICGPLLFSFDSKYAYYRKWPRVFLSLALPMAFFVSWDALVTGRHWWFNDLYTMDMRIAGLPPGEWLFFITVPFSCLFIWEVIHNEKRHTAKSIALIYPVLFSCIPLGILVFLLGKEYTGLVLITFGLAAILEKALKTDVLLRPITYVFFAIIIGLILVFNGYLTARPVVLYGEAYQLGFRVITIPIEDFGYGIVHLLSCTILYEKFKGGLT